MSGKGGESKQDIQKIENNVQVIRNGQRKRVDQIEKEG